MGQREIGRGRDAAWVAAALAAVLVLALAACGGGDGGEADADEAAIQTGPQGATGQPEAAAEGADDEAGGGGAVVIGESSPVASNPNQQAITYGQREAAGEFGWTVNVLDANLSPDKQVSDVDTFIAQGVDGITTWSLDPGAADAVYQRAVERGIPVVGFNSESEYIATVVKQQTDSSCEPGQDAAAYIAERIPGAQVAVIGGPPVPSIELRVECFREAAEAEGLEIVGQQDNVNDVAATAQPLVQNLLTQNPDLDAVFAYNDPSALGAAAAVTSAGKQVWSGDTEGVIIIGMNGSNEAIEAIEAGRMTATYDGNPTQAGAAAIEALAVHIEDGAPIEEMPAEVVIPFTRYDASNVAEFVPPLEREVELGHVER